MSAHITFPSPRATLMAVFATFGAAIGALAGSMPSVMRNAALDSETVGLGLTLSTLMTVSAMSAGGHIARAASNRAVLLMVLPVFAAALFAYLTAGSPLWFILAMFPMGLCFGLTDLFMNAEAVAVEHDMRRPVFMAFHGAVSIGVAVMAVAASYASTHLGTWATALLLSAFITCCWVMVYRSLPSRALARGKASRVSSLPNRMPLILLGIAAGLIIAAETAALLWSAKLLDELAPSLAAIAGLGAAFFGLCNAVVRFPGDRMRSLVGDMRLMISSLVVSILGFTALGFTQSFAASVAAFAMIGLGVALLIPCIFAMAARYLPENRAGALGFVSLLTALPRILGPMAFGLVASNAGTSFAFGLVALVLLAALLLIVALNRREQAA